jgi:selenocysteine lyase/cysteine desulfurase
MAARRQFTDLLRPEDASVCEKTTSDQPPSDAASYRTAESGREDLFRFIDRNQLGLAARITTEFGERKITFADYTASGRALKGIEDFIRSQVLPLYANTHTTASTTGMQSTLFRAEARDIVRRGVCADNNLDAVLFTGTGCTGAVGKMLELLRGTSRWRRAIDSGVPPVILVGPYEHHSNLLPWRESGAQVLEIREAEEGGVALEHLEEQLIKHTKHTLVVGTFSAASNVTGILTDTVAVATVLHRHGALAFFDYATAGPYCKVDMNPSGEGVDVSLAFKDAVFLSPHKFVGGVCTPGVLAFKRHLLERGVALGAGSPPCLPGGGTVFYVSEWGHRYLENLEEREEGGTPDIVGAIRCGLAFRVKEALGPSVIMQRAQRHWADALSSLKDVAGLELLGKLDAPRLPIVSFNVRRGAQLLHHNFVAALLNDLFGIQVRAGCACAGPYAQRCMGVSRQLSRQLEAALLQGDELLRPGFVRFNLPYCARECQTQFVLDAVRFVADQGWKLLPLYTFLPATGEWRHRAAKRVALRHRRWLSHFTFRDGEMKLPTGPSEAGDEAETGEIEHAELTEDDMWGYLKAAAREVEEVEAAAKTGRAVGTGILATEKTLAAEGSGLSSPEAKRLRWFMLPCEAHEQMCNPGTQVPNNGSLVMQSISDEIESTADVVRDDYHSAFEHFARGELLELLRRQPQAAFSDVLAIAGEKWRQLTPAARESYTSESFQASPMPSSDFVSHKSSIGVGGVSSDVKRVSENKAPEGFKPSARLNGAQEPSSGAPAGLCMRKPSQSQNQTNRAANDATILPGIDKKRVQKAEKKLLHLCGKAILVCSFLETKHLARRFKICCMHVADLTHVCRTLE